MAYYIFSFAPLVSFNMSYLCSSRCLNTFSRIETFLLCRTPHECSVTWSVIATHLSVNWPRPLLCYCIHNSWPRYSQSIKASVSVLGSKHDYWHIGHFDIGLHLDWLQWSSSRRCFFFFFWCDVFCFQLWK